jgi:hypothetical protein
VTKRALVITLMVAVAIAAVVAGPAAAHRPGTGSSHEAEFTGAAVVPPGDPDGAGTAQLILFPGREKFCYRINVSNVGDATKAHLHRGSAGENGPVVRKLIPPKDGFSRECVKRYGREGVRQIGNNLSEYYVDVHTDEYPDGAVRAQFGD